MALGPCPPALPIADMMLRRTAFTCSGSDSLHSSNKQFAMRCDGVPAVMTLSLMHCCLSALASRPLLHNLCAVAQPPPKVATPPPAVPPPPAANASTADTQPALRTSLQVTGADGYRKLLLVKTEKLPFTRLNCLTATSAQQLH